MNRTHRLVRLLPNSERLVVRPSNDEFTVIANRQRPDFAMMTVELLDVLKLRGLSSIRVRTGDET